MVGFNSWCHLLRELLPIQRELQVFQPSHPTGEEFRPGWRLAHQHLFKGTIQLLRLARTCFGGIVEQKMLGVTVYAAGM